VESVKNLFTLRNVAILASVFTGVVLLVALGSIFSPKPAEAPTITAPPVVETPLPSETPAEVEVNAPLYADCTAVWVALERPITEADEGYPDTKPNLFDGDSDGIGCEDNPATEEDESQIDWKAIWDETKGNAEQFGDWAGPKLKNFWEEFGAPTLGDVWDETKNIFGLTR